MKPGVILPLDLSIQCDEAVEFEAQLRRRIVGQEEPVAKVVQAIQSYMAGLNPPDRPIANILFLGPTGTGKTRLVESVAEIMLGDPKRLIKIDCAEFQEGHGIAKLTGSPSGYVGHKDTEPFITQKKLEAQHTEHAKISFVLFDEIEKAHRNFWDLLLGILDKGRLTLGNGEVVDFCDTIIFMTSNLGSKQVQNMISGGIGYSHKETMTHDKHSKLVEKTSMEAARKNFPPEFFNRLDQVVTFHSLTEEELGRVLEIELGIVQKRILKSKKPNHFVFHVSDAAKAFLIHEGYDKRYNARHLRRTVEKHIVHAFGALILSGQIQLGDLVRINYDGKKLVFDKIPADHVRLLSDHSVDWQDFVPAVTQEVPEVPW